MLKHSLMAGMMLIATSALAAEGVPAAAKIDFTAELHTLRGQPYRECVEVTDDRKGCKTAVALTLGQAASAGLSLPDRDLPWLEQKRRGALARKVEQAKDIALTSEDITSIKVGIGKLGLPTPVVDDAIGMLDPAAK